VFNILRLGFKLFSNEELVLLLEEKNEKEGKVNNKVESLTKHDEAIDTILKGDKN